MGLIAFAISQTVIANQNNTSKQTKSPVRLLPGYKIEMMSGFEGGLGGKISKDSGPTIDFGEGQHEGNSADSVNKDELLWRTEQIVNGKHVICAYTKSSELVITLPPSSSWPANFRSKIRNQQDLAEMLLMVLTFEPNQGYPVEPDAIVHRSVKPK